MSSPVIIVLKFQKLNGTASDDSFTIPKSLQPGETIRNYANRFRKILLQDVEGITISEIVVIVNASIHMDEMLMTRLQGLVIPKKYEDGDMLYLNITSDSETTTITSNMIVDETGEPAGIDGFIITMLQPNETLNLILTVGVGKPRDNSIYASVSVVFFKEDEDNNLLFTFEIVEGYEDRIEEILERAFELMENPSAKLKQKEQVFDSEEDVMD